MMDGIIVLDTKDRIVDFNPSAERIIGGKKSKPQDNEVVSIFSEFPVTTIPNDKVFR